MSTTIEIFRDVALERTARNEVQLGEAAGLLGHFSGLVRESGTRDEETAAQYIVGRLQALGIPVELHAPELYISLPRQAEVEIRGANGTRLISARPPAFAASTGAVPVSAELVYVPSRYAGGTSSLFDVPDAARRGEAGDDPVRGRVVLTEGFSMPGSVQAFQRRGAVAQIFIHPGDDVHEGICTPIWGAPTHESIATKPTTPVVCVNQAAGRWLVEAACGGAEASVRTVLEEGWMRCPLPVVEIRGQEDPDEFLLVHGHYDSWYVGIGDNATGDAALLELARLLWSLRAHLKRSVRIAWWPGHSTGRYAGSTWYADAFAADLDEWCIAQLDIDSPGCAGATAYEEVMWMAEAGALCSSAIEDAVGERAMGMRPLRAGDYSFNQIGATGFYMLLSNIPAEVRKARGYYAVGGCGGNTAWHTPRDLMDVADLDVLRRDLEVYVTTILRVLNAPLHPFDYAATVREVAETVAGYQRAAGAHFSFAPLARDLERLERATAAWRADIAARVARDPGDAALRRRANDTLRRLARILVPINYARGERFDHDPATKFPPVPRLDVANHLDAASPELRRFMQVGLRRETNKIAAQVRAALRLVQGEGMREEERGDGGA